MNETRAEKDREDVHWAPPTEPQGPHNVRMKPEDVHYWGNLTPREMSIWSAGYGKAEDDYGIPEEERL